MLEEDGFGEDLSSSLIVNGEFMLSLVYIVNLFSKFAPIRLTVVSFLIGDECLSRYFTYLSKNSAWLLDVMLNFLR